MCFFFVKYNLLILKKRKIVCQRRPFENCSRTPYNNNCTVEHVRFTAKYMYDVTLYHIIYFILKIEMKKKIKNQTGKSKRFWKTIKSNREGKINFRKNTSTAIQRMIWSYVELLPCCIITVWLTTFGTGGASSKRTIP